MGTRVTKALSPRTCPRRACRKWVATGQQKNVGKANCPYVAIWDVDTCEMLQKLDHDDEERAVIAVAFSGNPFATNPARMGE